MYEDFFIPEEQAQGLEDLGFKQMCLGVWERGELYIGESNPDTISVKEILAPTYGQAFGWFRERGYQTQIYTSDQFLSENSKWYFKIIRGSIWSGGEFESYEEARLECLKRLISC